MTPRPSPPTERLFPAHPCVDRYFPAASIEDARERLTRTVQRGDGPGLLIGGSGTGKSLLLEVLARQFADRFDVVLLSCAQLCTRRALLQAILFELNLPCRYSDEGELRLTLLDHLLPNERCPNGMLLLVDEAQSLPPRLLEELRLMSNLVRNGQPRVRLVLAGGMLLEEQFAATELESFQQRIATRCYLASMDRAETSQYVRAHLAAVKGDADRAFDSEALDAVFDASDGVPRLVNQLCDRTLLLTGKADSKRLSRHHVQQAWADLQQLPTPWETEPDVLSTRLGENVRENSVGNTVAKTVASVVEFGELAGADSPDEELSLVLPRISPFADVPVARIGKPTQRQPEQSIDDWDEDEVLEPTTLDDDDVPLVAETSPAESDELPASEPKSDVVLVSHIATANKFVAHDADSHDTDADEESARDPFGEEFAEEEVVLEEFAALGEVFRVATPRVAEQSAERHMSALVEWALEVSDSRNRPGAEAERSSTEELETTTLPVKATTEEVAPALETLPLITFATDSNDMDDDYDYDPVYPEDDASVVEGQAELASTMATIRYPGVDSNVDNVASDDVPPLREASTADDDDILVVEDTPAEFKSPQAGARRQDYSQLFANLRRQ